MIIQDPNINPGNRADAVLKNFPISDSDPFGAGLKYPIEVGEEGGFLMSNGIRRIGEKIIHILRTKTGTRLGRPEWGSGIITQYQTPFEYVLAVGASMIKDDILAHIPDIDVTVVTKKVDYQTATVEFEVGYSTGTESDTVTFSYSGS